MAGLKDLATNRIMRKIIAIVVILIVLIVGVSMNKYNLLYTFGQFCMDVNANDGAHFVMLSASKTSDPVLKSKAFVRLSNIAARHGKFQAGLSYAIQAAKTNPKNEDAWFMASSHAEKIGMPTMALIYIVQAISLNSDDPTYYGAKAVLLAKLHRFNEAKSTLEEMINKFPDHPDIPNAKAKLKAVKTMILEGLIFDESRSMTKPSKIASSKTFEQSISDLEVQLSENKDIPIVLGSDWILMTPEEKIICVGKLIYSMNDKSQLPTTSPNSYIKLIDNIIMERNEELSLPISKFFEMAVEVLKIREY